MKRPEYDLEQIMKRIREYEQEKGDISSMFGFGIFDSYPDCFMDGTQVGVSTGRQSSESTPLVTVLCSLHCSDLPLTSRTSLISY